MDGRPAPAHEAAALYGAALAKGAPTADRLACALQALSYYAAEQPDGSLGPPRRVDGAVCPACGQREIRVVGGELVCLAGGCPMPTAAAIILADGETGHLVDVGPDLCWATIKHPLIERAHGDLFVCRLHVLLNTYQREYGQLPGATSAGLWRVPELGDAWSDWVRVGDRP